MNLSPIQKIDEVLSYLNKQKYPPVKTIGEITNDLSDTIKSDQSELLLILEKLKKDGNVNTEERNIHVINDSVDTFYKETLYIITYEGKLLCDQNGYSQKVINQNAENIRVAALEKSQKMYANRMIYLTIAIAFSTVVAAVYYSIEIWKYYHPH